MKTTTKHSFKNPRYEVAEIIKQNIEKLRKIKLSPQQWKVINAITNCRTSALGGHVHKCNHCDHIEQSYNSCRNRHCPKCQALNKTKWIEDRMRELLPIPYFHVVFTIPDTLNGIVLQNKESCYKLFFKAVKETLSETALNPKNLGAKIGFISILHT